MNIQPNIVVALTYKLHTLNNGEREFVEEANKENPLVFLSGVGMLLPKFEENIQGLKKGDTIDFELQAVDAYGDIDEAAVAQLPAGMFKESGIPLVGQIIPLQVIPGNKSRAKVVDVSPEVVVDDLNHPMA